MSTEKIYQKLIQLLSAGESVVLATIFTSSGSVPRSTGTKMIVYSNGSIAGTIGGGRLEAETIEMAKTVHSSRRSVIMPFDLKGTDAAGQGMICGGEGKILIDYIDASNNDNQQVYEALLSSVESGRKAWLITELMFESAPSTLRQQCLITHNGSIIGNVQCDPEFLKKLPTTQICIHTDREGRHFVVEPIKTKGKVYIFGAGHVSQQIARLTDIVGFKTIVIDDRRDFANPKRFPTAEIIVIDTFQALPPLYINEDCYIVIVTRGHLHDGIILEKMLITNAAYIGMIGSKKKREILYRALEEKGVCGTDLKRVYSPIGVEIYAETPQEIAVSIIAELIKVRAERERCITAEK